MILVTFADGARVKNQNQTFAIASSQRFKLTRTKLRLPTNANSKSAFKRLCWKMFLVFFLDLYSSCLKKKEVGLN